MDVKDKVLSSVGAQAMDTSGHQLSDLDNVEFDWENDRLDVDAVFRLGIDTPFSPSTFNAFETGSRAENPIVIDKEHDMENSPAPHLTTPVSKRPTQSPVLMRNCPFGTRIETVPDDVHWSLCENFRSLPGIY